MKSRIRRDFPEVKGKTVEMVEIKPIADGYAIGIMFKDRTYLSFDVDVDPGITIKADLSDWKTKNYKPLKRWPVIYNTD
jgi:hypothetical protein